MSLSFCEKIFFRHDIISYLCPAASVLLHERNELLVLFFSPSAVALGTRIDAVEALRRVRPRGAGEGVGRLVLRQVGVHVRLVGREIRGLEARGVAEGQLPQDAVGLGHVALVARLLTLLRQAHGLGRLAAFRVIRHTLLNLSVSQRNKPGPVTVYCLRLCKGVSRPVQTPDQFSLSLLQTFHTALLSRRAQQQQQRVFVLEVLQDNY